MGLHVEVEHGEGVREARTPGVADEPRRDLRVRRGDEVHKAAAVRKGEREDEVVVDVVHGDGVRSEALAVHWTPCVCLDNLHCRQGTPRKGREVVELVTGDGALRGVRDCRAG